MFKKALLALGLLTWAAYGIAPVTVQAQNTQCSDRPDGDSSNACANTRFVMDNGGGAPGTCIVFTDLTRGCVPASGGGTTNFLRADGTWAAPPGTIPVGGIMPWAGATVPGGFLLAFGQAIDRTTFSQLLTAITFNETVNCTISNPTVSVAIGTSDRVPVGAPIEGISCFAGGTTVLSKGSGTLTMSTNAVASTSTSIRIFPYGNGDAATTFNVPNLMGRTIVGRDNMSGSAAGVLTTTFYGASPDSVNVAGGAQSSTLVTGNLPAYTPSGTVSGSMTLNDPGHTHTENAVGLDFATFGGYSGTGNKSAINNPIATSSNTTGITITGSALSFTGTAQGGASTAFSRVQPSLTMDYVIKAFDVDATVANLVVGTTIITGGSNNTVLYDNGGILGELAFSTANEYNCADSGLTIVSPSVVYQAETTTTYGTTTTFDFCTFKNTAVTLTGDITTMTFTNVVAGRAGMITFIQDGSGNHTTVWNSILKFSGGTAPTLSTAAGAVDILTYACRSATFCGASLLTDVQ